MSKESRRSDYRRQSIMLAFLYSTTNRRGTWGCPSCCLATASQRVLEQRRSRERRKGMELATASTLLRSWRRRRSSKARPSSLLFSSREKSLECKGTKLVRPLLHSSMHKRQAKGRTVIPHFSRFAIRAWERICDRGKGAGSAMSDCVHPLLLSSIERVQQVVRGRPLVTPSPVLSFLKRVESHYQEKSTQLARSCSLA